MTTDRRSFLKDFSLIGVGAALGVGVVGQLVVPGVANAATAPRIYSCAEWGARPPADPLTTLDHKANRILIHHIASANSTDYSLDHAKLIMRNEQADHIDNNGWSDTGEHFVVTRGGYDMEGRHGSLSTLQDGTQMIQGAHCPGQNTNAIGIENEGTYTSAIPPAAQWNSLVALCVYVCQQYGIPSTEIKGHRDYYNTECPGDALYAKLPQLRSEVQSALG